MWINCQIFDGPLSYMWEIRVWCEADERRRRFLVGNDANIETSADGSSIFAHEFNEEEGFTMIALDSLLRPVDNGAGYFWVKKREGD